MLEQSYVILFVPPKSILPWQGNEWQGIPLINLMITNFFHKLPKTTARQLFDLGPLLNTLSHVILSLFTSYCCCAITPV